MLSATNWGPLQLKQLCEQIIYSVINGMPVNKPVLIKISPSHIKINSNQSHHLAIVLNELATNSVKYGLPAEKDGCIDIRIFKVNGTIHLQYKDNGPGYPEHLLAGNFSKVTIGMGLIQGIVSQSLDGELKLQNNDGAVADIRFLSELDTNNT
jgi:two-component sensor histidine kinase